MIIKRKVQACSEIDSTLNTNLDDAKLHIRAAINCLCTDAEVDIKAQQAIANLSVILFDLDN